MVVARFSETCWDRVYKWLASTIQWAHLWEVSVQNTGIEEGGRSGETGREGKGRGGEERRGKGGEGRGGKGRGGEERGGEERGGEGRRGEERGGEGRLM